jgi:type II secretory pathway pseudopilin PulG
LPSTLAVMHDAGMNKRYKSRRGFTLVEAAIVLGVIAIIIGAIWAAAAAVEAKHQVEQGVNQVWQIAINARNIYTGHPFPGTLETDVSQTLITQNVITSDMLVDPSSPALGTVNPWNGTYVVAFHNPTQFYIKVLPPAGAVWKASVCSDFLSRMQATGTNPGAGAGSSQPEPPVAPPASDTTQGGAPTNAYFLNGTGWIDVTGQDAEAVANALGAGGCSGVAFYFTI